MRALAAGEPALLILEPALAGAQPRTLPAPTGAPAPLLRPLRGALAEALGREARRGTTAFILELDARAQRLAATGPPHPTVLLVSQEEGGFARRGFWLERSGGPPAWHPEPYVNMVIDADSVRSGEFEEIFAHESGHVLLRRLLPRLPSGYSRTRHGSLVVTDYPTAFDEGFAIHFQALARRLTVNPALRATDAGVPFKPYLGYWQDAADGLLRIVGVRRNLFVQAQLPAADLAAAAAPDATPLFAPNHLKNGQQMLAAEGVIATLFYHLLAADAADRAGLTQRYAALLASLQAVNETALSADTPVFLRLVGAHARLHPAERARWIGTVAQLTYCATAEPQVAHEAEALAAHGIAGDAEAFAAALAPARRSLQDCTARLLQQPERLEAALGQPLWVAEVVSEGALRPVNLNTAESGELRAWLGFAPALVQRTLDNRAAQGPFTDLADFARRLELPADTQAALTAGAAAVAAAGPYARE